MIIWLKDFGAGPITQRGLERRTIMDEIDRLEDQTKNFSQFGRELHIKDNFKDQMIWQYLNRSNDQKKRELSVQNDLVDLYPKLGSNKS